MSNDWKPIETAPKDEIILLYRPEAYDWAQVAPGKWDNQKYHTKPRPYWDIWLKIGNITEARLWAPTHWMPFPKGPQ